MAEDSDDNDLDSGHFRMSFNNVVSIDQNMLPIVNVLEHVLKLKRCSRIWLCPTAAFTLHAAHPFQTKPCLEDLYIRSCMPTLLALIRSRQSMKKRVLPSFVAIGQGRPGAGKGKALLAVDSELELAHKLVPATANRTTISGDKVEFAFLSACHTAVGDEEISDEVIPLAAGIQFSGFKNVVGMLWEVDDAVAKDVVEAFYEYMFGDLKKGCDMDCTRAAWALKLQVCYARGEDESAARTEDVIKNKGTPDRARSTRASSRNGPTALQDANGTWE
ncbi:uncharacterized protein F5891DRAFT_982335 [Suillus fuscotomentosus]|uniref:CHAT domain-containing protein n=1 Tax=Suillus fuscotomentosus TaxID=1912939 RepID=A0AAD4E3K5_9AGAM|nr:uncharacterized protein F5891DRAFT_982335 [Suillus fuscotomentosus]KAG1897874.1 hypothetical protein F5891DRAFT_982335 [Suillus fuscotomentosus]